MTNLLVNDDVRAEINKMIERAEEHPMPMAKIMEGAITDDKFIVELKDRKPGFERPPSEHMVIPMGYRVALTIEEQPAGWCKHLSISVPTPGNLPTPQAAFMIAEEFGFKAVHKTWLEEFSPGHLAVNLIYLYRPAGGFDE